MMKPQQIFRIFVGLLIAWFVWDLMNAFGFPDGGRRFLIDLAFISVLIPLTFLPLRRRQTGSVTLVQPVQPKPILQREAPLGVTRSAWMLLIGASSFIGTIAGMTFLVQFIWNGGYKPGQLAVLLVLGFCVAGFLAGITKLHDSTLKR